MLGCFVKSFGQQVVAPVEVELEQVAIIVLHYRTPDILQECLRRLVAYAPAATIIVVDTDVQAETRGWLEQSHPQITLLACENHSMAHAINTGIKHALSLGKEYLCHMNADVYIEAGILQQALAQLQSPQVAIVSPRAYNLEGKAQQQGFLYRLYYWRLAFAAALGSLFYPDSAAKSGSLALAVPWLSGCIQLFSRDFVLAVGGLDSSLRFYNEDMDWCLRARRQGWRCLLLQQAVLHLGGSATPSHAAFWLEGLRGGYKISQRYRSRFYQWLHRWGIVCWARVMVFYLSLRLAPDSAKRYRYLARQFTQGNFEDAPFNKVLNNFKKFVL